jgi:DNA-binding transcriptional MocR family regulator
MQQANQWPLGTGLSSELGAGLSIWAWCPDGSSTELAQIANRSGVSIVPALIMSPLGPASANLRLIGCPR